MAASPKELPQPTNYLSDRNPISWLTTIDHKRIAVLYGVTTLAFLLIGGVEALLIRLQLAVPNGTLLSADGYNQVFTMHGTTMIFLVVMPVGVGFFSNFVVPLQIGARDVAFPRLNALSYWLFLFGGLLLHASFLWKAAPDVGWFGYANLTERYYSPGPNVDFWVVSLLILGVSSVIGGVNFFVTIVNMRAPGLTFMRLPLFTWSVLVMFVLILVAFPPLTVGLIFLWMDRAYGTHFYEVVAGATPLLWQHLFWLFGHPEVYIMVLPAFGIMSEIVPVFSRKPLFGYPMMVYSTVLIGFLSYGVWAHHMFAVGMGPVADSAFMLTSMLIAIPTGIKIFSWIATIWGGSLKMKTPFYFALAFILQFTIGGLSGIMHASPPIDLQQTDSYFVVAHFHYVLFGGTFFALVGGLYYWWPKVTGRLMSERLGKINFWLTVIGFNATFFPMHILGAEGMPRRVYQYPAGMGWDSLNMLATVGAFILGFAVLVLVVNMVLSLRNGEIAGDDPWDARTLEWTIPSPPPEYNFARIPVVHGRDPFWLQKYGRGIEGGQISSAGATDPTGAVLEPGTPEVVHVPPPSIFPLVLAAGILVIGIGMMVWTRIILVGAAASLLAVIGMAFELPHYGEADDVVEHQGGLDNRKIGIWAFIGSETLFFASLISTYLIYKNRSLTGPTAKEILEIPLTSGSTFILLMSSLLMVLSLAALQRADYKWSRIWLFGTIACGLMFLGGQVYEFTHFYHEGLSLQTNLFGQTFFTLVGFHGAHVTIGVIWLMVLAGASLMGGLESRRSLALDCAALYWHFVDIVWIIIFSLIYLMKATGV